MATHTINPRARGTASATNAIMAHSKQPEPEVGMGATILGYTDRYAATIIAASPKSVTTQHDYAHATKASTFCDQDYTYEPNPKARRETWTLRRNGAWVKLGEPMNGGTHLVIGERDHYVDPSF